LDKFIYNLGKNNIEITHVNHLEEGIWNLICFVWAFEDI